MNEVVVLCQLFVKGATDQSDEHKPDGQCGNGIDATRDTVWFGSQHGIVYVHSIPGILHQGSKPLCTVVCIVSILHSQ